MPRFIGAFLCDITAVYVHNYVIFPFFVKIFAKK